MLAVGIMQISLADAPDQILDLAGWLRDEDALRGRVHLVKPVLQAGEMGGIPTTLSIILSGSGTGAVAIRSYFTWLKARHSAVRTRIHLKDNDGRELSIELSGAAEPIAVLDEVEKFFRTDGD
jgi:hypothetical protein